jgi:hypothetical protein
MDDRIEHRLQELLRNARGAALPLRRLHGHLVAEAGPAVGTYARFAQEVRSSRAFILFEPEDPLGDTRYWPPALRHTYEKALSAAGVERGPRLALAAPPAPLPGADLPSGAARTRTMAAPGETSIAAMRASLLDVWETAGHDAGLREAVATAFADCAELPQLTDRDS